MAKPNPNDPNNKSHNGGTDTGQCTSCGGSGTATVNGQRSDCPACGGSGKR